MSFENYDPQQLHEKAKGIVEQARSEKRDLTEDEQITVDAIMDHLEQSAGRRVGSTTPGTGKPQGRAKSPSWIDARSNPDLVGRMSDGGFSGIGEFLTAVADTRRGRFDERLEGLDIRSQQGIGSGSGGGYLVPERFAANLLMTAADEYPFLALRDVETINGAGSGLVRPKVDDRDRSGEDIGGIAMQRVSENSTLAGQTVSFESQELRFNKAAALIRVSNELMSDSGVGVERALNRVFSRAVGQRQALDFVSGTGSGEPLGFLKSNNLVKPSRSASNEISLQDIGAMTSDLIPSAFGRAIWMAHPSTASEIITLSDSASRNVFVGERAGEAAPTSLLGRPLFYSSALPTLGNEGDLCLVDPTAYMYVHRQLVIDVSEHVEFEKDQTAFRAVLRDDGHPHYDKTVTDEQGDTLGEFVALS